MVSSTNKTDCHDITEILLKVALNTIKQTNKQLHPFLRVSCEFDSYSNNSRLGGYNIIFTVDIKSNVGFVIKLNGVSEL
jgi:hypothetical protein